MSDSEDSMVTCTEVSSPFEDLLDIGSSGVIVHGYDGMPTMPEDPYAYVEAVFQALPSPDYVPGPEEPEQAPPLPELVPEPVYPEFMPPEDDVLLDEEQPQLAVVSPTLDSSSCIAESDPEEDPEEEDDEDPDEDPADYPTDRHDDEEEDKSSGDDADDEDEDEDKDGMSIPAQTLVPFLSEEEIPSPPIPVSPPLPISSLPIPASPTHQLGYRAVMIRLIAESPSTSHPLPLSPPIILPHTRASMAMMRVAAPSTYCLAPRSETPPSGTPPLLPIPLPTSSPPLLLHSTDRKAEVLEVLLPPRKRLCIAPGPRYEIGDSSSAPTARHPGGFRTDNGFVATLDAEIRHDPEREVGYRITDVWEDPDEIAEETPAIDVAELGQRMTNFVTAIRQDTDEIYVQLGDAHDDRLVMNGQLNLLRRDRRFHARTTRLMESEARLSRKAWRQSMDASDTIHSEVMGMRTIVLAHQTEIEKLWAADHRQQTQLTEALTLMWTLQTQMAALKSQQGPARGPAHPDVQDEAGTTTTTTTTPVTNAQLKALIDQGVADALAARDADKRRSGDDSRDSGTEGVVELSQWFKRMEYVFYITHYTVENQTKLATCTLFGNALTWWNSHIRTVGHNAAYAMTYTNLKKMMTDKYCPRGEINKLEIEMWNLKVKGTDVSDKIEKYVGGLPDMINGSVMTSKPKTMQEAIEIATELMEKKISTFAEHQVNNKRKFNDTSRNNQSQQQPPKRNNVAWAYIDGSGEKKSYEGSDVFQKL
ncbi:putative reverse transcriptase domain-containing protein [Tanacetum coccineum]